MCTICKHKHSQMACCLLYLHWQACTKTPPSTMFSSPFFPPCLCLTHEQAHYRDTKEDVKHLFGGRAQFLQSANEHTGFWWGLGSVLFLPSLTCYIQPSNFLFHFVFYPADHCLQLIWGIFIERLCHMPRIWQVATVQRWWHDVKLHNLGLRNWCH